MQKVNSIIKIAFYLYILIIRFADHKREEQNKPKNIYDENIYKRYNTCK